MQGGEKKKRHQKGHYLIMSKIEYDNIIENKTQLLKQLESIKQDAIENMRNSLYLKEIFQMDVHALRIVINYIKENVK